MNGKIVIWILNIKLRTFIRFNIMNSIRGGSHENCIVAP
jgi:hypothetical protein